MEDKPSSAPLEEFRKMLHESVAEANRGVTHADFVVGVRSGELGFRCMVGEPLQFIRGTRRMVFSILVLLYLVAPTIFVSLWAWHEHGWWLLLGIVVSAIGTWTAAQLVHNQKKQYPICALLFFISLTSWLRLGIHSYYTFFALCGLWGLMLFMIAEDAQNEYAIQSLVEHRDIFERAIAQDKIMIVRKDDDAN